MDRWSWYGLYIIYELSVHHLLTGKQELLHFKNKFRRDLGDAPRPTSRENEVVNEFENKPPRNSISKKDLVLLFWYRHYSGDLRV